MLQGHFGATHTVFLESPSALSVMRRQTQDSGPVPFSNFEVPISVFRTITNRLILGHLARFPQVDAPVIR